MTLRARLALGLLTIAIILVVPLAYSVRSLQRVQREVEQLQSEEFAASLLLGQLREGLVDLRQRETALNLVGGPRARAAMEQMDQQMKLVAAMADSLDRYELVIAASNIRGAVREVNENAPAEFAAVLEERQAAADSISANVIVPALNRADTTVQQAEHDLRTRTTDRVADAAAALDRTTYAAGVSLLVALLIAAAIALWLTASIARPVRELEAGMSAVADGTLDHKLRIAPSRGDEFGRLAKSFDQMVFQLNELDKLKAEFVSVASHELKTPINVIIGYLQLLEEGIYGPLTKQQLDVHKTLGNQAQALLRLVKQLLDVSRFEAGGGRLEPRPVHLERLLEELERAFHVLAVQREVTFRVEHRGEVPEEVVWDVDRINEVLGNLLSNAFKFTPRGGEVALIVEGGRNHVKMQVQDTGAGIPPEQLPRIFEKFYQADNQRAASVSGSGLGLAIAKQIVEAHGGTISCTSTLGQGTSFIISLPPQVRRRTTWHRPPTPRLLARG